MRKDIFETILKCSFDGFKAWKKYHQRENYGYFPSQQVLDEMRTGPLALQSIVSLAMVLQYHSIIPVRPLRETLRMRRHSYVHELSMDIGEGEMEVKEVGAYNIEDLTFDEYDTAPAQKTNTVSTVGTYTFIGDGILQSEKTWSLWIDRGLRIVPGFHKVFSQELAMGHHTQGADDTVSHLESSSWTHSSVSGDLEDTSTHNIVDPLTDMDTTAVQDVPTGASKPVHFGLRDMLDEAGPRAGTVQSQNVFLSGKACSGDHIKVCPENDSVAMNQSSIVQKVDIDSLIWVGRRIQFHGACNIYTTPVLRHVPPFSKSNHVSIRLLLPPTRAQWENYQIGSESKCFQLSQIPHMDFGYIGDGDARFNIIVCFPRMTFKPAGSRFMKTLIPLVIQEVWLTNCVLAALQDTFKAEYPGTMEYIPHSCEDLRLKQSGDRKAHTFPLSQSALLSLQDRLSKKLKENPSLMSRFGSFFFVVDSRGFKLLSKQLEWKGGSAVQFQEMLPCLDLKYMMEQDKGELFLDMGISYHAERPEVGPLVGLWKLSDLTETYKKMGFRKPTKHHTNTLLSLGGMQAQTKRGYRQAHHILSRLSYNLVFQVVRSPGTKEYLTSVDNAINGDKKFVEGYDKWTQLFSKSSQLGYGVRDEIRGGAQAIFNMLDAFGDDVISQSISMVFHLTNRALAGIP